MKDNKLPGVDGIPPKLLKEIVEQISTPLAKVFNLSLEWKEANIMPLFKKGSRNKPENYRPVSLTSVVCKLLETLIRDHMVEFLVKHKLINTSQHGFLKARSCLTGLHVDDKLVGLSISQWLPCPLAIWNLFGMAILLKD